jgi:hypothetical protein
MTAIPQPFNEMQLEIIKLFARDMSTEDMKSIKGLIVRYFAQKAIQNANKVWDDNGWTKEDETRLLNIHERTPYMPK